MKNIINLVITFTLFWVGSEYFSENITIVDTKTLVLASIFMFVISYLFSYAMFLSFLLIPVGIGCLTTIPLMLAAVVLTPIKLWLLDKYLVGFHIEGFWTYVVITVVLWIFSVKTKSTSKKTT